MNYKNDQQVTKETVIFEGESVYPNKECIGSNLKYPDNQLLVKQKQFVPKLEEEKCCNIPMLICAK